MTAELLKYAEAMELKARLITMGERIAWGSDTEILSKGGDIIKVLVGALEEIASIADCHQAGIFSDSAHKAIARATEIVGVSDESNG